jgi:riboflavin transporter FmnP
MKNKTLNTLVKTSILGAMAFIIMFLELPLPLFPSFLKLDFSDIPALLGAFALGPVSGIVIELLKNVLHGAIKGSTSMWVGELANFLVGSAFVYTAGLIYQKNKSRKTAVKGIVLGIVVMSAVAALFNYFVLLPFYATVLHFPIDAIVQMGSAVNPLVTDLKTLILWAIIPFNMFKGIVIAGVTVPLYKKVSPIFHREAAFEAKNEKLKQA